MATSIKSLHEKLRADSGSFQRLQQGTCLRRKKDVIFFLSVTLNSSSSSTISGAPITAAAFCTSERKSLFIGNETSAVGIVGSLDGVVTTYASLYQYFKLLLLEPASVIRAKSSSNSKSGFVKSDMQDRNSLRS